MTFLLHLDLLLCNFTLDSRILSRKEDVSSILLVNQICSMLRAQLHFLEIAFFLLFIILTSLWLLHLVWFNDFLRRLTLMKKGLLQSAEAPLEDLLAFEIFR